VDRVGKQNYKVIDTNEKWILYHNCFSLCSRKVRLCLEELEIEYKQEHIDLIETGKYEVASKNFLRINPGATVPVLLHEGYPIYESHEQIYYLTKESSSSFIIPSAEDEKKLMDYWVKKSSMVGDPMENQHIYAGNCIGALTFPLFASMIKFIKMNKILAGLISHPLKIRVFLFIILKIFGYKAFSTSSPIRKLIYRALKNINDHLHELDNHLKTNGKNWIINNSFTLADISWAVILHRIEEVGWDEILFREKTFLKDYFKKVKAKQSFKSSIINYDHEILDKGKTILKSKIKEDQNLKSLFSESF
jgi:glutathione S-transferase